jgi:GNAT superfamily N-acetyltransferase
VTLRRLGPDEVELHRRLRLRALADSPDSFGELYDEVRARPPDYWDDLTRAVTAPGRHAMFLAGADDRITGCVYGLVDARHPRTGRVGGMWVEPPWRGQGIGRALLEAVTAWARERGFTRLELAAPVASTPARALYRRAGFVDVAAPRAMPGRPHLAIVDMGRDL